MPTNLRAVLDMVRALLEGPNEHHVRWKGIEDGECVVGIVTVDGDGRSWENELRFRIPEQWLPWLKDRGIELPQTNPETGG